MRRLLVALAGSLLSAGYWWTVFTIVYADALFAGDRDPAAPPLADRTATTRAAVAIALGILAYAGLSLLWRRITAPLPRGR